MLGNIAKILGKSDSKRHPLTCTPERAFEWIDDRLGYTHDNLVGLLPCPRREILEAQLGLYQDIFDALELLIEGHTTTHDLHQFNDSPRRK